MNVHSNTTFKHLKLETTKIPVSSKVGTKIVVYSHKERLQCYKNELDLEKINESHIHIFDEKNPGNKDITTV